MNDLRLFSENNLLENYLKGRKQGIGNEIEGYTFEKSKVYTIDSLKEYLVSNNQIDDIPEIIKGSLSMQKQRKTEKEKYSNDHSWNMPEYQRYFDVDYLAIYCEIGYSGDARWFEYRPNWHMSSERDLEVDSYGDGII